MKKILITGATGFIGKQVYANLNKKSYCVYVVSRKNTIKKNWYEIDILDHKKICSLIKNLRPEVLIHLAWDVTYGKFWDAANNELYAHASQKLFYYFVKNGGKKIIAAGTSAEYPTSTKAVSENMLLYSHIITPYGRAKRSVFEYLESLQKRHRAFEFFWLRIFGVYGPGENEKRFFPTAINAITSGFGFEIKNHGVFFDYVYVEDLANFIIRCIYSSGAGAINIGTGKSISMLDLYRTLENYIKYGIFEISQNIIVPNEYSRIPDCSKLKKHGQTFNLGSGFEKTIQYYKKSKKMDNLIS